MNLTKIAKQLEKFAADNSPAILTGIGVTGTLTTAYLTGKASFKAAAILSEESPHLELKEKVELTWKLYLPPAFSAALTVSAIICANRVAHRRAAAMAAVYSLTEKAFEEYREKVKEKLGQNKEREIRDEIAQDRVNDNPVRNTEVIIAAGGDVLCYDMYTGRYFESDLETLKKAQNDTNYQILNDFYASLGDFYRRVGLKPTENSEDVGWNSDELLELQFSTTMSEDDRPCIAMSFRVKPISGYYRVN